VAAGANRAAGRLRRLRPGTWPVRWRLAAASAGLTLAILLVFAAVIGYLAAERVRSDFNRELRESTSTLASNTRILNTAEGTLVLGPHLHDFSLSNGAIARVLNRNGEVLSSTHNVVNLGPVSSGITDRGSLRVAAAAVLDPSGTVVGYVQYARSEEQVNDTINRLWLLIAAGVLGGTLMASLAGLAIAGRAMRPIASLTATAGQIADTRDPSRKMPQPRADDEIGELAHTLEKMLRSLDAARAEREGAMQKQREFVADASHELRTPLTSVLANLELLQASLQAPGQAEGREMIDSALRSSRRMSRLVADLLLLARADAGRIGERRRCDFAEVAGNAAVEVAPVMGERRLVVDNGHPIFVEGNPDELHRMVVNLLDNAAHHTPTGSRVELRLRTEDGRAVLEVSDDGPGIPPELRDQVFDRFVRGNGPADVAAGTGTGLGLAIVRAVAISHGGTVEATESPQGGALFRIRFRTGLDPAPNLANGRDTHGSAGALPNTAPADPA
jgi:two-component system OmpR family sensor kinase